jgi:DNA repair protein SbcD/Mre11
MKYAHFADLHLGAWREPKMRKLSTKAFLKAIDACIRQQVDFILFAGDLFNTALPSLDILKLVTKKLKELHVKNIPVYAIAGSHDFSPTGKTMLDVLENAGLLINVCRGTVDPETKELHLKFTTDCKTKTNITGIIGRRGLLDKTYYQNLHRENLESEPGYKIFMFHTTLTEMKPIHLEMMDSTPVSFLPKGFNYYAGGHIHHPTHINIPEFGTCTYPGALFPNSFAEVEKYQAKGGYYLVTVGSIKQTVEWEEVQIIKHQHLTLSCTNFTPEEIETAILTFFEQQDLTETVITLRLQGKMQGRPSAIPYKTIYEQLERQGAYSIMRNTVKLHTEEFEEVKIVASPEEVEERVIKEHLQQVKMFDKETEFALTKSLLQALTTTKQDGETVHDFQERVLQEMDNLLQSP